MTIKALWAVEHMPPTKNNITENCIACKYDEDDDKAERCKKCIAGDSQFELDDALIEPTDNDVILTYDMYHELIANRAEKLEQESVLDKIRAEIEQLPTFKCTETHHVYIYAEDFKENVLKIIDKYKAGTEVDNRNDD